MPKEYEEAKVPVSGKRMPTAKLEVEALDWENPEDELLVTKPRFGIEDRYDPADIRDDPEESQWKPARTEMQYEALFEFAKKIASRVQRDVIEKLIRQFSKESSNPVLQLKLVNRLYEDLLSTYHNEEKSLSRRFTEMAALIANYRGSVPANVMLLQSWLKLLPNLDRLRGLSVGTGCADEIEIAVTEIRKLFGSDAARSVLPEAQYSKLVFVLERFSHAVKFIRNLKNIKDDATFGDYLKLIEFDGQLSNLVPEGLVSLVRLAEDLKNKLRELNLDANLDLPSFPAKSGNLEKIDWLIKVADIEKVRGILEQYFDLHWVELFKTPAALMQLAEKYPAEKSVLKKLDWLVNLENSPDTRNIIEGTLLQSGVRDIKKVFEGDNRILPLFDFLSRITEPGIGKIAQLKILASFVVTPEVVKRGLSLTPLGAAANVGLDLFDWYKKVDMGGTWQQALTVFIAEFDKFLEKNRKSIESVSGLNMEKMMVLVSIVKNFRKIPGELTWEKTIIWLIDQARANPLTRWYYDRFLDACLTWQLYQVVTQKQDADVATRTWQRVQKILGDYFPEGSSAAVELISTLWSLLPGLIALRKEGNALPETTSWIAWLDALAEQAGKSNNPAVKGLVGRVEDLASRFGVNALLGILDNLSKRALGPGSPAASAAVAGLPGSEAMIATVARQIGDTLSTVPDAIREQVSAVVDYATMRMPANSDELGMAFAMQAYKLMNSDNDEKLKTTEGGLLTTSPPDSVSGSISDIPEKEIIWGDESKNYGKKVAGAFLAAYWLATGKILYEVYKSRNSPLDRPTENKSPETESQKPSSADDSQASEKLLENTSDNNELPKYKRILEWSKQYRTELALGAAVTIGGALTAGFFKKHCTATDIATDVANLSEKIEIIDVAEIPEISEVFDEESSSRAKRQIDENASKNNLEKIKSYSAAWCRRLDGNGELKKSLVDLINKISPKLITKNTLMSRMHDDFALLVEMDIVCLRMQQYIIYVELKNNNYTNFKSLLMLNQLRNFIMEILLDKYKEKVSAYYSGIMRRKDFVEVKKFWEEKMIEKTISYVLHIEGVSDEEIESYHEILKTIIDTASVSAVVSGSTGTVGFVGEDGLIKIIVESIKKKINYYDGKLLWDSEKSDIEGSNDPETDAAFLDKFRNIAKYLDRTSKLLSKKGVLKFTYPGGEQDYVESAFIKERIMEVAGADGDAYAVIPVEYSSADGTTIGLFSLDQILQGFHIRHKDYENNNSIIKWPSSLDQDLVARLLEIPTDINRARKLAANIDLVRGYIKKIDDANIDGIRSYADRLIKAKAAELGIKSGVDIATQVVVSTKEHIVNASGMPDTQVFETFYSMGEIAFKGLKTKNSLLVQYDPIQSIQAGSFEIRAGDLHKPAYDEKLKSLVEYLDHEDFQKSYQNHIDAVKKDADVKKAFDEIMRSRMNLISNRIGGFHQMRFWGYELPGLLMYVDNSDRIRLVSFIDDTDREFVDINAFYNGFRKDPLVRNWILSHSVNMSAVQEYDAYLGIRPGGAVAPLSFESTDNDDYYKIVFDKINHQSFSFFSSLLEKLYNEADVLAASDQELATRGFLKWLDALSACLGVFLMPLSFGAGFAAGVIAEALPNVVGAILADDYDQAKAHWIQAAIGLLFESAAVIAPAAGMLLLRTFKSSKAYRRIIAWLANTKLGKYADDVGRKATEWFDSKSIEWERDISNEIKIEKTAAVEENISELKNVFGDYSGFKGKNSREIAEEIDNLLAPDSHIATAHISAEIRPKLEQQLKHLHARGKISVKFRSMNVWSSVNSRQDHIVAVVKIDGVKYVIDPSPIKISNPTQPQLDDAVQLDAQSVLLEQEWVVKNQQRLKSKLIKYKDFKDISDARSYCSPEILINIARKEHGTAILNSPDWYQPDIFLNKEISTAWMSGISLDGLSPDADGIYRIASLEKNGKFANYIRNTDGAVYEVRRDKKSRVWTVIDPNNPSVSACPIMRKISGRWIKNINFRGKSGAALEVQQVELSVIEKTTMIDFMKESKRKALEKLDITIALLKNKSNKDESEMVATVAEVFWGRRFTDRFGGPAEIDRLRGKYETIRRRVVEFNVDSNVNYYNAKISKGPDGRSVQEENIVAELDPIKYETGIEGHEAIPGDSAAFPADSANRYVNVYASGVNVIQSRADLGADHMGRVIIHEMTHAKGGPDNFFTDDYAYLGVSRGDKRHDLTSLAELPFARENKSSFNADSYSTFVQYITGFKKSPGAYKKFKDSFAEWKLLRVGATKSEFIFPFNEQTKILSSSVASRYAMSRSFRDRLRNLTWNKKNDDEKIESLIGYAAGLDEARELSGLVGRDAMYDSIEKALRFDFEGVSRVKFSWGQTYHLDLERIRVRLRRDIAKYRESDRHLNALDRDFPKLVRDPNRGSSPEHAAAEWILSNSRSADVDVPEIIDVLNEFKTEKNLFDRHVLDRIHDRIYRDKGSRKYREVRTADDELFMSLDVSENFFDRWLKKIPERMDPVSEKAGDMLYASIVRAHPYGYGNGRTARVVYALHRLKNTKDRTFKGLEVVDEDVLSGLSPASFSDGVVKTGQLGPGSSAGPSSTVLPDRLGTLAAASNRRNYDIVDAGQGFEVGYARVGRNADHLTAWSPGEKPLDNSPEDLIINAGIIDTRHGPSVTGNAVDGQLALISYIGAAYRVSDQFLADLLRPSVDDKGAPTASESFKPQEFSIPKASFEKVAIGAPTSEFKLRYPSAEDPVTDAVDSAMLEYVVSHYAPNDLIIERLSLVPGTDTSDIRGADMLNLTAKSHAGRAMSIRELLQKVDEIGPEYRRVHLTVCRPLAGDATLIRGRPDEEALLGNPESNVGSEAEAGMPISHLVTLITLDRTGGTFEETVQGVIEKASGKYMAIDPAAGDTLQIPEYAQRSSGVEEWGKLGDDVLKALQ